MRIKTQFVTTMLLFGVVLVVVAASVMTTSQQVERASEKEKMASSIAQGGSELSYLANDYLIYRESQQLKRWQTRFASFSAQVAGLRVDRPEQQALLRNIQANQRRLKEVFDSVTSGLRYSSPNQGVPLDPAFFQVSWSRMAVQSQGLMSDASRLSQLLRVQADRLKQTNMVVVSAMIGVFGVYFLINYVMIQRRTLKSIATLQAGTAVIGSGNLDFIIEEKRNDEIGELSRAFNRMTANLKDVTASKSELEREIAERKKAEETLQHERDFSSAILDTAGALIVVLDSTGQIVQFNQECVQTTGYSAEEVMGKSFFDLFLIQEEIEPVKQVFLQLQSGNFPNKYENHWLTKNGQRRFISWSNTCVLNGAGQVDHVIGTGVDTTERKRAEEELRRSRAELEIRVQERTAQLARANQELQEEMARREKAEEQLRQAQKLESIGTLTGGIAHDFNNLLGAIVINSEMALFDLPKESGVRSNLELILKSGLRGKGLVRQMLLFSRKSEKRQEILSLTPLIKETFKLLRSSLPTTIQMKLHLETESDAIYADPSQIQQVIMNLCTNAAYAMRGTTGSIDISLQGITFGSHDLPETDMQPGDYLVLSVKDTGSGMDEEVRKRIFEPFFTTKPVGEGTGLGLSVVYGIVKSHKGNITVYSEPGRGSLFKVYIPRADTGVSEKAETPKPIPGGDESILLVDDEEFIVNSVRNMLQHLGYKVTVLMDSEEALKIFSGNLSQFDLVITDQTMPFMTGEDLGKELMRIRPDIPVILCTGYSDLISSEKATAMGFRGFIMKPFTVREGAELVRRVLDQKGSK